MKKAAFVFSVIALVLALCLTGCGARSDDADLIVSTEDADVAWMLEETTAEDGTETGEAETEPEAEPEPETEQAEEPEKERTTLIMAGLDCTDSKIKMAINEFNNTNKDYKIVFMDYANGISVEQGETRLLTKILSNSPPDMLLFENLSPLSYIGQGLLLDLDPFVAEDPDLSESDFIIWDALHEYGGLYLLGSKFMIETVYCTRETAEAYENWTLEDYIELQNSLENGEDLFYYMDSEMFLQQIGSRYIHRNINTENGTCDFENPEFIAMLETACDVRDYDVRDKHTQPDGSFKSAPEMMLDNELLFCEADLRSSADIGFDMFRAGGERMGYIGWPVPEESRNADSGTDVYLCMPVGICAGSDQAAGCWEFIKFMLQNPTYMDAFDGEPVLESLLEDSLAHIIENSTELKWETNREDQEVIVELARNSKTLSFYDEDILGIIQEEAEALLDGTATSQEVAARIQNRASLLISERYG